MDFADKGQPALIKPIEKVPIKKVPIATVVSVECPSLHPNSVRHRFVDQLQSNFRFRSKLDIVWDMSFFRRERSSAYSWGKYMRAAMRLWKLLVAKQAATVTTAFSTSPRLPLY